MMSTRVTTHKNLRRVVFFFFFQAEDGIRDLTVTGVQTCALPIFIGALSLAGLWLAVGMNVVGLRIGKRLQNLGGHGTWLPGLIFVVRSEERRVGKECRSRWSPYH